jgi:hypothetical protein
VASRRNWEKFGQTLDNAENEGFEQQNGIHAGVFVSKKSGRDSNIRQP